MEKRRLGKSNLEVSALGLGCMGISANYRSEEHTSELQSRLHLVCRLLLEKKKNNNAIKNFIDGLRQPCGVLFAPDDYIRYSNYVIILLRLVFPIIISIAYSKLVQADGSAL